MTRIAVLALSLLAASAAALPARAQTFDDETRDRALLLHQSRGTLAPGTRPKCFPARMDETVASSQWQCPWDRPNGQPRLPTIRSLFGLTGTN